MMVGADLFKQLFDEYKSRPIMLYGDPDVDGLISLLFMCQFCDMFGLKYTYYVNEHRYHGFTIPAKRLSGYLVLASDFSITEHEMQILADNDVAVLSTDHHDIQSNFIDVTGKCRGIVLNNQYPFEPEEDRYLSGAGVFYELVCSLYPDFKSKLRDALVGITLLSDVRATEGAKAHKYLKCTYGIEPTEPYIKYLIDCTLKDDFSFGTPRMDRNFVDFTLNPTVNALLRFNRVGTAVDFILGKGLGSENSGSYRERQKDLIGVMHERAMVLDMPNICILAINDMDFGDYPELEMSDFIGLFCSSHKDKDNNKSTLGFVLKDNKIVRASFRGKYDSVHYLASFRNMGLNANGHPNAFGLREFEPTTETWVELNDLIGEVETTYVQTYKVIETTNLAVLVTQIGYKVATENCYVRDSFRTYFKYAGVNIKINKETYKTVSLTSKDLLNGVEQDGAIRGTPYRFVRDVDGNKVPKYIEYIIDGRTVKSFGVIVKEGIILPILEKGYIQLYVRPQLNV